MTFTNPFVKMIDAVKTGTALWSIVTALLAALEAWSKYVKGEITWNEFWLVCGALVAALMAIIRARLAMMKGPAVPR